MNNSIPILLILTVTIIIAGIIAVVIIKRRQAGLGSLNNTISYRDTDASPGEILSANTLPLKGKPDYILHTKDGIIPVEIKTGKTPVSPYENHSMQLMAYCLLVAENYKTKPIGGILRYQQTGTEFKIAYTKEAEQAVRTTVSEILTMKATGEEPTCHHPEHNA